MFLPTTFEVAPGLHFLFTGAGTIIHRPLPGAAGIFLISKPRDNNLARRRPGV